MLNLEYTLAEYGKEMCYGFLADFTFSIFQSNFY